MKKIKIVDHQANSEITAEIELIIRQFIRCSKDRPFDIDNPSEDSFCEGCTVERNVIMDLLKSYRRAFGVCE